MKDLYQEIRRVYVEAREAGIPQSQIVVSLSADALVRLMDESHHDPVDIAFLNHIHLSCSPDQQADVALGHPTMAC